MRIDAHQHFWHYNPIRDTWIDESMSALKRDFLPTDLFPILKQNSIDGCIAVQADQSEKETQFLIDLAHEFEFIKGVVGWLDLRSSQLEEKLIHFQQEKKLVGLRHIVQSEPDPLFMEGKDFKNGIHMLEKYGLTFDILIYPSQLKSAYNMCASFPRQKFVIDHLAKPYIKKGEIDTWKEDISAIASLENVYSKVSGLVTEASWLNWQYDDFQPYLDHVFEVFGEKRVLFGSDWPVCFLAANYAQVFSIVEKYCIENHIAKEGLFGQNAINFYNLQTG